MSNELRERIAELLELLRPATPSEAADAILALPGIAVVELPDGQIDEHGEMSWHVAWPPPNQVFESTLWVSVTKERWSYVEAHDANVVPPRLLRKFAAALLAAAEYAEREQ